MGRGVFRAQHGENGRRFRNVKRHRRRHGVSSSRIALNSLTRAGLATGYCRFSAYKVASTICDTIKRVLFLSSAGTTYPGDATVPEIDDRTVAALPDVLITDAGRRATTGLVATYSDRLSTTTWETLATDRPEPTM